jgi:hypothetical protein
MSNFVRNFKETFDFDGDTITVTLKQLRRVDAMELMPIMAGMKGMDPEKPETLTKENIDKSNKFVDTAARIIEEGKYITSMQGLTIEGEQVHADSESLKEVLSDFYFTGLVSTIATLLLRNSSIAKSVEKKSDAPSSTPSAVSKELPKIGSLD